MTLLRRLVLACCLALVTPGGASAEESRFSADTVVHVIGVYEGSYPPGVRHSFGRHPDGAIALRVDTVFVPVVLVLTSYEPVVWTLELAPGVDIAEIILSGYHPSSVEGVDRSVRVSRQSLGYAYKNDEQRAALEREVMNYTGLAITSFQSSYKGKEFSVY